MTPSSFRWYRDSLELDVFDATRYFSGDTDSGIGFRCTSAAPPSCSHKPVLRKSFDVPLEEPEAKGSCVKDQPKKPPKQPVSPGMRLASFFNSFFPQTPASKKKTKDDSNKKKTNRKTVEDDGFEGARRRRRNSLGSSVLTEAGNRRTKPDCGMRKGEGGEKKKKTLMKMKLVGRNGGKVTATRPAKGGMEDGDESDESSDLFELKSFDLRAVSFSLPVFGSTGAGIMRGSFSSASAVF